jgi:hypothetical protein
MGSFITRAARNVTWRLIAEIAELERLPLLGNGSANTPIAVRSRRSSEVGVRWSPAWKDVSPEADEHPPLEAVTEQRD